jgi:hypothetical protein
MLTSGVKAPFNTMLHAARLKSCLVTEQKQLQRQKLKADGLGIPHPNYRDVGIRNWRHLTSGDNLSAA